MHLLLHDVIVFGFWSSLSSKAIRLRCIYITGTASIIYECLDAFITMLEDHRLVLMGMRGALSWLKGYKTSRSIVLDLYDYHRWSQLLYPLLFFSHP